MPKEWKNTHAKNNTNQTHSTGVLNNKNNKNHDNIRNTGIISNDVNNVNGGIDGSNCSNCSNGNDEKNDMIDKNILHDTVLLLIISLCGTMERYVTKIMNIFIKIIKFVFGCLIKYCNKIVFDNRYVSHYIEKLILWFFGVIKIIVRYSIVYPIVDTIYPIVDIKKKFDSITANDDTYYEFSNCILKDDIFTCGELTQDMWNRYLVELHKKDKSDYDMFDIMIDQQFNQVNFWITLAINRTDSSPRQIPYAIFYKELKNILGAAIDTKYRLVKSGNKFFFDGIFGDDGIYRKLKYFDTF